jgi:hypothetical protein
MTLPDIHRILSTAFLYFTVIIAVWALIHIIRRREIGGNFWGAVVIGEGLALMQMVVGGIMLLQGRVPARPIHFLYGAITLLTWPAVFAFTRGATGRRETLYWVLFSVFLFGITLRAIGTGG